MSVKHTHEFKLLKDHTDRLYTRIYNVSRFSDIKVSDLEEYKKCINILEREYGYSYEE